ncbi:MAG: hypothetical protein ABJG68_00235 [Crocinitomicaceae bacterium]
MRTLLLSLFLSTSIFALSQDSTVTFWEYAKDYEVGETGSQSHEWGSEEITYLGIINWKSPSGKELQIRVVVAWRKITKANGFNDQTVLALVKTNHGLIKTYDFVKRQNLPKSIENNELIYEINGAKAASPLPTKFSERFCVDGLTCFSEVDLSF